MKRATKLRYTGLTSLLLLGAGVGQSDGQVPSKKNHSAGHWQLVWDDEFNGNQLDTSKWSYEVNCDGGGNNEQQCYTARRQNTQVKDGVLTITARRENYQGLNSSGHTVIKPYTSARIRTLHKGDWRYGHFEIRAKLPVGQGVWPAIWMLPSDWVYGRWPTSGEIDIMEAVNLTTPSDATDHYHGKPETRVYGTLHYGRLPPDNVHSGRAYYLPDGASPADGFHVYGLTWQQGEIRWYVDGIEYAVQRQNQWYSQYQDNKGQWHNAPGDGPFNQRFHLLINLAIGGGWPEAVNNKGVDPNVMPQQYKIDYVRVYQCSADKQTGKGCSDKDSRVSQVPGYSAPPLPTQ